MGASEIRTIETSSAAETAALAERLARASVAGAVLGLSGDLGAGKTTFVRGYVKGAGGDPDQVTSPTFTLLHDYAARLPIFHLDLYRLENAAQAREAGIEEYVGGEGGVALVEWFEHAPELLPQNRLEIRFEIVDEFRRRLVLSAFGSATAWLKEL